MTLQLTSDEALVLINWLPRCQDEDQMAEPAKLPAGAMIHVGMREPTVLWIFGMGLPGRLHHPRCRTA